ncbi:hypothetical protein L584_00530 [Pantoea agglomerans Tx10]|nr:hypothetical protein L584_00530 [Pantoea agglomerans Tx10]
MNTHPALSPFCVPFAGGVTDPDFFPAELSKQLMRRLYINFLRRNTSMVIP